MKTRRNFPEGGDIADGEPDHKVDENDGHQDGKHEEDQLCHPGRLAVVVEVLKVKLAKEHHDNLQEAVAEVAEDLRVGQQYVEGECKSQQVHRVGGEEFKDCPCHLKINVWNLRRFYETIINSN